MYEERTWQLLCRGHMTGSGRPRPSQTRAHESGSRTHPVCVCVCVCVRVCRHMSPVVEPILCVCVCACVCVRACVSAHEFGSRTHPVCVCVCTALHIPCCLLLTTNRPANSHGKSVSLTDSVLISRSHG